MAVLSGRESSRLHATNFPHHIHQTDWLECNMAESSPADMSDGMMPDEMLEVLQTEMDDIKEDQKKLKDEINDIKARFYNLIHSCAFDDSNLSLAASMVVPEIVCNSPHQIKVRTATPGKDPSPKHNPVKGCSYGDKIIQMMLDMPSSYLDDTDLSESPPVINQEPNSQNQRTDSSQQNPSHEDSNKAAQLSEREPSQHKVFEPVKLDFDNKEIVQGNVRLCNKADLNPDTTTFPEDFTNKPFHDSIRFNPNSVLNSTSICAFDVSKSMLNCTPAALNCTAAEGYRSILSEGCPPVLINPASVLPAAPYQSLVSYNSVYINPASVLDCSEKNSSDLNHSPALPQCMLASYNERSEVTHGSEETRESGESSRRGDGSCQDSGDSISSTSRRCSSLPRGVSCDQSSQSSFASSDGQHSSQSKDGAYGGDGEESSTSSSNSHKSGGCDRSGHRRSGSNRSRHQRPSSRDSSRDRHYRHTILEETLPSQSNEVSGNSAEAEPVSMLDGVSTTTDPPSMISYNSRMMPGQSMSQPASNVSTPLVIDTNQDSQLPQQATNPPAILDVTPAVTMSPQKSYAVHSTPAIHTSRNGQHFEKPMCSAIVDYSVSSDSEQSSADSSRPPESATGDESDIQPCPDRKQEMMSRMKYYSDFTVDRQYKINKMRKNLDLTPCPEYESPVNDGVPNDTMCRYVEGAEERSRQVCLIAPPYSGRTSSAGSSSSGGSSTLQKTAVSVGRTSNSPSPRYSNKHSSDRVLKSTENTRHLTPVAVSGHRQRRPSSTTSGNSTSPSSSVYAWSLPSSSHPNTESSDHSRDRHHRSRGDKRPRSSRKKSTHHHSSRISERHPHCRDHDVHTMLGQPCHQIIKYLPIQQYYSKDLILSNDSLYDDGYKSQTLPRSSTKKSLNPSSKNSSLEAKRNSVPDIYALKSPANSALVSSGSDTMSSKYPPGRMGCIGMSNSGSQESQTGTDSSVPKGRTGSSLENNENTALTDSILTDSPKSVCSSGIFAPCNSPDATTGSRISCSTIADSHYQDLKGLSVIGPNATGLSSISTIQSSTVSSEFKVPRGPAPKRSSRRKGNRCSTPDVRTSTPKPQSYPNSMQSEQISPRKLFSSSSSTHSSHSSRRSVIKKIKQFKLGKIQIKTLANL